MRITFSTEGGVAYFPGLSKPTVIESDQLDAKESQHLTRLIDAAKLLEPPAKTRASRSASHSASRTASRGADQRQYTLTIEDGKRKRNITVSDPISDSTLKSLVDFVQTKVREQRGKAESS